VTSAPLRHHTVRVPATSANLGPGFDAFGLALDRHLVVATRPRSSQAERVVTVGEGAGELATGDDNLIWRSLVACCEAFDLPVPDVALRVVNAIPTERGLGSSSSAIVAGVALGRALSGAACSDLDLVALASRLEGHPDNVAPAVLGGFVACTLDDTGRQVVRRVNPSPALRPILLVPPQRQRTDAARTVLPESLSRDDAALQASRAGHVVGGILGAWSVDAGAAGDRLHEPARARVMEQSAAVLDALRSHGVHAWLSGAGPSVVALCPAGRPELPEALAEVVAAAGFEALLATIDLSGAFGCPDDGCGLAGGGTCVQCPRQAV
jgi:homoserine kinase